MARNFIEYTNADLAKTQLERAEPEKKDNFRF